MGKKFKYDVFLSFSSLDLDFAKSVFEKLKEREITVFFSDENLKKNIGLSFDDEIENALVQSKDFVLVCTPNAMQSEWVKDEYKAFYHEIYKKSRKERRLIILQGKSFDKALIPIMMRRLQIARTVDEIIETLSDKDDLQIKDKVQKILTSGKSKELSIANEFTENKGKNKKAIIKRLSFVILLVMLISSMFISIYLKITEKEPKKVSKEQINIWEPIVWEIKELFKEIYADNIIRKEKPQIPSRSTMFFNLMKLAFYHSQATNYYYLSAYSIDKSTSCGSFDTNNSHIILELKNSGKVVVNNDDLKILCFGNLYNDWIAQNITLFRFNIVIDNNRSIDPQTVSLLHHTLKRLIEFIPPVFEVQVIKFSDTIQVKTEFTKDKQLLISAITHQHPQGDIALYDAIDLGVEELKSSVDDVALGFSIVITNHKDNMSKISRQDFIRNIVKKCRENFIPLLIIGVSDNVDSKVLSEIAGFGLYQHVKSFPDLNQAFQVLLTYLKDIYIFKIPAVGPSSDIKPIYLVKKTSGGNIETVQDFIIH